MDSSPYLIGRDEGRLDDIGDHESDKLYASQRVDGKKIENKKFSHCTFANVSFLGAELKNIAFEDCVFLECYFRDATLVECNFKACKFMSSDLRKVSLGRCDFKYYNSFFECWIPFDEIAACLPGEFNLRAHLSSNLASQAKKIGEIKDARRFQKDALEAQREHLRSAFMGRSSFYRSKYPTISDKLGALASFIRLYLRGVVWGHRYPFWVVLRNWAVLSLLIFPALYLSSLASIKFEGLAARWEDIWFISLTQILPGTGIASVEFQSNFSRLVASLEAITGLLLGGVVVSLLFQSLTERWRS